MFPLPCRSAAAVTATVFDWPGSRREMRISSPAWLFWLSFWLFWLFWLLFCCCSADWPLFFIVIAFSIVTESPGS